MSDSDAPVEPPEQPALPERGCLFGLDYGSKRIGIAVCDGGHSIASPLTVLRNDRVFVPLLREAAAEYAVVGLVVGLPVHMSGDEGEKAREARAFGDSVAAALKLPIVYYDERFTSKMANQAMADAGLSRDKRKARVDMLAAQIMLQSFLDSGKQDTQPGPMSS